MRCRTENETYERIEGGWRLRLQLPGLREGELKLALYGLDLDLALGKQLRRIPLPETLRGARLGEAEIVGDVLCLPFLLPEREEAAQCGF